MRRLDYVLQFRRAAKSPADPSPPTVASGVQVRSTVGGGTVISQWEDLPGDQAVLDTSYATDEGNGLLFLEWGAVTFGPPGASSLEFSSISAGVLLGPPDPDGFSQGTVMWRVTAGTGELEGARGAIVSNFLVDLATEELVDNHLGLIALP
jgi:hypothetical protein